MKVYRTVNESVYFDIFPIESFGKVELINDEILRHECYSVISNNMFSNLLDNVEKMNQRYDKSKLKKVKADVSLVIKRKIKFGPGRYYTRYTLENIPLERFSIRFVDLDNNPNISLIQCDQEEINDLLIDRLTSSEVFLKDASSRMNILNLILSGHVSLE